MSASHCRFHSQIPPTTEIRLDKNYYYNNRTRPDQTINKLGNRPKGFMYLKHTKAKYQS